MLKIYVVKYQPRPRGVFRTALVTENLALAKARRAQVRRGCIVTWRGGHVVSCEEPPGALPAKRGMDLVYGPRELAILGGDLGE